MQFVTGASNPATRPICLFCETSPMGFACIHSKRSKFTVLAAYPLGDGRREARMRDAHDQLATGAQDAVRLPDRPCVVLYIHQAHRRDNEIKGFRLDAKQSTGIRM